MMNKKMKFLYMILLTGIFAVLGFSSYASATVGGKCGEHMTWTLDDEGTLTFSGSGEMDDYVPALAQYEYQVKKVVIGADVTDLKGMIFGQYPYLTAIEADPENSVYASVGGVLFSKDKTVIMQHPAGKGWKNAYEIPDTVVKIKYSAFHGCSSLEGIIIPNSVKTIGHGAFRECSWLTSMRIPDSVTDMDQSVFFYCMNLEEVSLSGGMTEIPAYTFQECRGLRTVHIPKSITKVGIDAFSGCGSLTDVYYGGTKEEWAAVNIESGNDSLLKATIHYNKQSDNPKPDPKPDPDTILNPFKDVAKDEYYYEPVLWAVDRGITQGTSDNTFSPEATCTRGQIVTFLWRAAGEPEPVSSKSPFSDVYAKDYYYKAVLWAVENGITAGTSATTFSPANPCTRAQVATFLWRAEGQPKPAGSKMPFVDVEAGQYYWNAVIWAVENQVTAGTSATTFAPDDPCTRGQIVTFLYRAMN